MYNYTRFIICILFFSFSFGCRKQPALTAGCLELKYSVRDPAIDNPPTKSPRFLYHSPRFNPLNANEIIFILADAVAQTTAIMKYNLVTGVKTTVLDPGNNSIWGHPDWSKKGWIVFTTGDNSIWKIRDNGDGLVRLTDINKQNPIWNNKGDRIMFGVNDHINRIDYVAVSDENGYVLDTLFEPFKLHGGSWSPDSMKIATSYFDSLGCVYLSDMRIQKFPIKDCLDVGPAEWFPNSESILSASYNGLFVTNINSGDTRRLKEACSSRRYSFPSISPDGQKIITSRSDSKVISDTKGLKTDTVYAEINLYIMDADGSNEHKIVIN